MQVLKVFFTVSALSLPLGMYSSATPQKKASTATQRFLKAVSEGSSTDTLAELFEPIDVNARDSDGWTPLATYCQRGDKNAVDFLFAQGANPDLCTSHGYTPLHLACWYPSLIVVQTLLSAKANPNIYNKAGLTPLMGLIDWHRNNTNKAERYNINSIIRTLIAHPGTNLDLQAKLTDVTMSQSTALMLASRHGDILAATALLDAGADVFIIDQVGNDAQALAQQKIDAEGDYNKADKFMAIRDQIVKRKKGIKKITPITLHQIIEWVVKVEKGERFPLDITTIIDSYVPKELAHKLAMPMSCAPLCHCPNKPAQSATKAQNPINHEIAHQELYYASGK